MANLNGSIQGLGSSRTGQMNKSVSYLYHCNGSKISCFERNRPTFYKKRVKGCLEATKGFTTNC